jgi:hypothetical protein
VNVFNVSFDDLEILKRRTSNRDAWRVNGGLDKFDIGGRTVQFKEHNGYATGSAQRLIGTSRKEDKISIACRVNGCWKVLNGYKA